MTDEKVIDEAIETLQQLGLQEYEAQSFVGLARMPTATAKQLSEVTNVPRTRVYDAIRGLEQKGLVEIRHESPQRYRAVPLTEATATLRKQYERRIERVEDALDDMGNVDPDQESSVQEVWTISGAQAIEQRANALIRDAEEEVMLVVCSPSILTEELVGALHGLDEDITLLVGAVTESLRASVAEAVPEATTFVSGLEWLSGGTEAESADVGRLLVVDRSSLLVSSIIEETGEEKATFGTGFGNGMVVVARRLMSQGLLPRRDPGEAD